MTLEELRRYTNTIADKHRAGKTLTEVQFNDFIDVVNLEMFNAKYGTLVQAASDQNVPLHQILINSTELIEFKKYNESITLTSGIGVLPSGYRYYLSAKAKRGKIRDIDFVSDQELNLAVNNVLFNDLDENPKAVTYEDRIKVVPTGTPSIILNYLKIPDQPVYDYCVVTATNEIVYMPIGYYILEGDLYATSLNPIKTGVVHLSGATAHVSDTVELEWRTNTHPEFADRVLSKMGIRLKDGELYQMVQNEKQTP